jgi:branched-chain amino acid transport system permease protein
MKRLASSLFLIMIILAMLISPFMLGDYLTAMLFLIFTYVILTVSWWFFCSTTKYVSLGTAAFVGLGAYITALFCRPLSVPLAILLGGCITFLVAFAIGLVTLRLKGVYFTIFTFGLSEFLSNAILWYENIYVGTIGRIVPTLDVRTLYYAQLAFLLLSLLFIKLTLRTKIGLALKAIGESEDTAIHCGVNHVFYKSLGFAISSMLMGIAGGLLAIRWAYIDPRIIFNPLFSFQPPVMATLGGVSTFYGPILGAIVLSSLSEYLSLQLKEYYMIFFGIIIIVVIYLMPGGVSQLITIRRKGQAIK